MTLATENMYISFFLKLDSKEVMCHQSLYKTKMCHKVDMKPSDASVNKWHWKMYKVL